MTEEYVPLDYSYRAIISAVLNSPRITEGRNGTTVSQFGVQLKVPELMFGKFPLLLGRYMYYESVFGELAAFFRGPKCLLDFEGMGCKYWSKWADEDGSLRLDYGNAWRNIEGGFDQVENVIHSLKTNPYSRRHLVVAWDAEHVQDKSLPSCHYSYQWYVNGEYLEMIWIQRSVDLMIGLPSDIILAAAWNIIIAALVGLKPGVITMQLGDVHIYEEHVLGAVQYLQRVASMNPDLTSYPNFELQRVPRAYDTFLPSDIKITEYNPEPPIKFLLKE